MDRIILHCDMNNFYASVETLLNPKLKGKPVAVCGSLEERHGIVLSKSEEAKAFGVKTGEAIWQARQKCPDLLIVSPHYEEYLKYSKLAREIYYDYTNQVEPFGIDECWLDCTGSVHLFGSGIDIANQLRKRIKEELGLTISVGVSFNKVFAKLASDLKKPDATTVIMRENFKEIVWPLEVSAMIGIGRATTAKLRSYGIDTLGELAKSPPSFLKHLLGINGITLWKYANGMDDSIVYDADYKAPVKSIGHGVTCTADLVNNEEVKNVFMELSFNVSKRLKENGLEANGVQISVRDEKFFTKQYQTKTPYPIQNSIELAQIATELFIKRYDWKTNVRSLAIRAIDLTKAGAGFQMKLFCDYISHDKKERLDTAIQKIKNKYGKKSITFASLMGNIKMPEEITEVITLPAGVHLL